MSIVKPSRDEAENTPSKSSPVTCPICNKEFEKVVVEEHVNKCLFLNSQDTHANSKRSSSHFTNMSQSEKRMKLSNNNNNNSSSLLPKKEEPWKSTVSSSKSVESSSAAQSSKDSKGPLAEQMRPINLDHLVGQREAFGPGSMLRSLLEQNKIPNMILWGPPGCGKTSVANIVANICKEQSHLRFVKLSATMSGISDVKEVVKVAKNEAQFKRQTVLFMDEIHRFHKLQQDTFLPHVESGTITLIGATTENPSFSLNNALLSRCRVVILEKLKVDDILAILERALEKCKQAFIVGAEGKPERGIKDVIPRFLVERASLRWLAEVCDGDARIALGALELALNARDPGPDVYTSGPATLTLEDIQDGIKRSHMVYDHHGEEHYNTISALHKSIRAGDDNAALYWITRALHGGEDPLFIARRLVRAACEDIGLAEPSALVEAVACLRGCRQLGMPECDALLAQCAVRLARAPKSREVYSAMKRCQRALATAKGPVPPIPLHLRNAPTKLMKNIGYGRGYNLRHKDESGLQYMPEGMEDVNFFQESDSEGD